jgi:hypothetical protein
MNRGKAIMNWSEPITWNQAARSLAKEEGVSPFPWLSWIGVLFLVGGLIHGSRMKKQWIPWDQIEYFSHAEGAHRGGRDCGGSLVALRSAGIGVLSFRFWRLVSGP